MVVGPNSDLWDVAADTGRLIVHICRSVDTAKADIFAGLRPNPGGIFAGSDVSNSEWGPVLTDLADRAYCSLVDRTEMGYSGLFTATIDELELTSLGHPLVYFRGRYRELA